MKIEQTEITVKKISRGVYVASCDLLQPIKANLNMRGATEENAKTKLELLLNDKPYNHIP